MAVGIVVLFQVRLVGDWRVDDAYITFAFSKNLAQGRGPIFSYDVRVEGYTNFLWMVLNAGPIALFPDADPLVAARALAFVFLALFLWSAYALARLFVNHVWAAAAVLVLACWTDLTRAALSGLETIPYAALLTAGILSYLKELQATRRHSLWFFSLAALMRISGMNQLALITGFESCVTLAERGRELRSKLRWALPPLLLFAAYFAWRWSYYGLPLPTTYYAKTLVAARDSLRGWTYLLDALRDLGGWFVLPWLFYALGGARKERRLLFLACVLLAEVVTVIRVQGDWMPFSRFWIPSGGVVATLVVVGMQRFCALFQGSRRWLRAAAHAVCAAALLVVAVHVDSHHVTTGQEAAKLARAEHERHHTYSNLFANRQYFAAIIRKPGDVLVTDYGGIFGYYTEASLIEMWGLCNKEIALRGDTEGINPIYGKTCIECYREFDPDYFHIKKPLVRAPNALRSHSAVVNEIFQGRKLDRVLGLRAHYVTGRVLNPGLDAALFFIEKRRPGKAFAPRVRADGFVVDYPFEPSGAYLTTANRASQAIGR